MATAGGPKRNPDSADGETAITCGSLQGAGGSACWAVEVDGCPAGKCKASAQVTPSTSPLARAGLNSIAVPGIEANQDKPAGYEAILASAGPGRPPRSHHQRPLHQYAGNVMTDVLPGQ